MRSLTSGRTFAAIPAFPRPSDRGRLPHGREQRLEIETAVVAHPVDEERRRATHAAAYATHEVIADLPLVSMFREVLRETTRVEAKANRGITEILRCDGLLVLVDPIVHLPVLALRARGLGRLGRRIRERMQRRDREVAEHEADVLRVDELLHDRIRRAAVGALEVAVFDERDLAALRSAGVILRSHWHHEARRVRAARERQLAPS